MSHHHVSLLSACALSIICVEFSHPESSVHLLHSEMTVLENHSALLPCGARHPRLLLWLFTPVNSNHSKLIYWSFLEEKKVLKFPGWVPASVKVEESKDWALRVSRFPLAAAGRFTCEAVWLHGSSPRLLKHHTYVTIAVPVSQPRLSATEVVVAEGKEVEVDCHSQRGSPPISYFWTRVGAGVAASGWSAAGPLLHLSPVGRTDAGVLLCTAMNFASSAQSFPVKLQVLFGPDSPHIFTLKDHAMQEVTESSLTLAEGHPIRLVCRASSEPMAQLTWWPGRPGMGERIGAEKNGWLEFPKVSRHDGGHYVCSALNPVLHNRVFSTVNISVLYAPDQDPRCSVKPTNDYRHITLTCMWEGGVPEASITWVRGGETGIEEENNLGASTIGERKMASNAQVLEGKELRNRSEFTCLCLHPTAQRACRQTVFLPPGEPHCQADFSKHSASAFLSCQWPGGQPTALLQWFGQQGHQLGEAGTSPLVLSVAAAAAEKHELAGVVCRAIHPLLRHGSWDCRPTLAKRSSFPVIATTLGVLLTLSILASTLILVFHHLRKRERQKACGSAEETESELASRTPGAADSSTSSYQAKHPKPGSDLESETQRKTDSEQAADVETDWRMESVAEKSDLAVTEVEVLAEVHSSGSLEET